MKRALFTIATKNELEGANKLKETFGDLVIIGEKEIKESGDNQFAERGYAAVSNMLLQDADEVIGIAPNLTIGGDIDKDLEGEFDAVVFRNENALKLPNPKAVWDVAPHMYVSKAFFCIKNKEFAKEWLDMCFKPFFGNYKNREEDVLNMLVYYGDYKCKIMNIK